MGELLDDRQAVFGLAAVAIAPFGCDGRSGDGAGGLDAVESREPLLSFSLYYVFLIARVFAR